MQEFWTYLASLMGVLAFFQGILHVVFPPELRHLLLSLLCRFFDGISSYCYFDIPEFEGINTNELYNAAQLYLSTSASVAGSRLTLTRAPNAGTITCTLSNNDSLLDTFRGVAFRWEHVVTPRAASQPSWHPVPEERRGFTLRVPKKDRPVLLDAYLDNLSAVARDIQRRNRERFLYTNPRGGAMESRYWEAVPFKHPSNFDTLAMDPGRKAEIVADLREFADGESFYRRTGRSWKRGYLLYGPPGTGKSSMIAAMANLLGFDIYDLELTIVLTNADLRKLLMKTTSKSVVVIEDIDCSLDFGNRSQKQRRSRSRASGAEEAEGSSITLSGLLNFTDGLWSCCGSERIFVFTTNHAERLDPALLRSGRMDNHIHMSYCTFPALTILLRNYLGIQDGELEVSVSGQLEAVVDAAAITPADVGELLIKNRRNRGRAMEELVDVLKKRAAVNMGREENPAAVGDEEREKRASDDDQDGELEVSVSGQLEAAAITPADVGEVLIKNRRNRGRAMEELVDVPKKRAAVNMGREENPSAVGDEEREKRASDDDRSVFVGGLRFRNWSKAPEAE